MQKFVNADGLRAAASPRLEPHSGCTCERRDGFWIKHLPGAPGFSWQLYRPIRFGRIGSVCVGPGPPGLPAAATGWGGGVDDGGSYSWLSFCRHSFPSQSDETRKFRPSGLFYTGSVFFFFKRASLPLWLRKRSAGLLGWEWIYVLALLRSMNGSESLRGRKRRASTQLQGQVILEDFGEVVSKYIKISH